MLCVYVRERERERERERVLAAVPRVQTQRIFKPGLVSLGIVL
jgi:hypothetical protein